MEGRWVPGMAGSIPVAEGCQWACAAGWKGPCDGTTKPLSVGKGDGHCFCAGGVAGDVSVLVFPLLCWPLQQSQAPSVTSLGLQESLPAALVTTSRAVWQIVQAEKCPAPNFKKFWNMLILYFGNNA